MCRALRFALLGCLLLALPAAAAETPPSADVSTFLTALSPLAGAIDRTIVCPLSQFGCGGEGCIPDYDSDCGPQNITSVDFIKQKGNGKCVYRCNFSQTCNDANNCPNAPDSITKFDSFRVRIGPVAPGACPPPDPSYCTDGEFVPTGEPD